MKNGDYILVVAPNGFPGKKYRGRYCYEHICVYWEHTGIMPPKGFVIHHIDGNKHNNSFENLKLLTEKEHHSEHKPKKSMVELKCPGCGGIFVKERRQTHLVKTKNNYTCCSRECVGKFSHKRGKEKHDLILSNVIREYKE